MKTAWPTFFLAAVLSIGGLAMATTIAQAGMIHVGTNFNVEVSTPTRVGVTPLWAVTLTAIGKDGALVNGFDGTGTGGGITTDGNLLHQVWEEWPPAPVSFATPTLDLVGTYTPEAPFPQELDTHFLVLSDEIIVNDAPAENRSVLDATEDLRAGFGDSLTGTFSLDGVLLSQWDFAYLVVPAGTEISLDFDVGGKVGSVFVKEAVSGSFDVIPEPSGLLLLVVFGALALLPRSGHR